MKDEQLDQVTKRTASYWYVDGLAELGTGFVFLVLGVFYLALTRFPPAGIAAVAVGIGQPLIILLGVFGVSRVVRRLKERITFPRTGYVSYRRPPASKRRKTAMMAAMLAAVIAMLVTLAFARVEQARIWLLAGVLGALVPVMFGFRLGLPRFYVIAGCMVVWSIVINFLPVFSEMMYSVLFYGGLGVIVTGSGAITLLRYLRNTRPADEVQDE